MACLACVLYTPSVPAQVAGPESPEPLHRRKSSRATSPSRLDVELALVNTTVTDPYGRLVTGLEKENFRIYEDGVEQEVATFSSEDVPISIGVIFDMSGSMSDKADKSKEAAVEFFKTANPRDEFFMVSFNDRAELTSRFTSSIEELQNSMLYMARQGPHGLARCHLSRTQPNEGCTQRQARLAHHIGWGG